MIEALLHNVIAKPIPQPEEATVKTVDGEHPDYLEVVSVGSNVQELEPGDYIFAAGELDYRVLDGQKYFILPYSQIKFKVSKDLI